MSPGDDTNSFGFSGLFRSWQAMTEASLASARATNQAMLAPLQATTAMASGPNGTGERRAPSIPSLAYERDDWTFERSVDKVEDIEVGDTVRFSKTITEEDIAVFADVSGDTNRLHLEDEYAESTRFEGRIAHGTIVSGLISAALARLPGLTIYLSQVTEFLAPVRPGQTVTAVVEVVEDLGGGQYRLTTVIEDADGNEAIDGEAVVLIDEVED